MPKEVADALKKQRPLEGGREGKTDAQGRRQAAMIPELGHYALVLALALGADPVGRAADRRAAPRHRADGARRARPRWRSSLFVALSFAALTACYVMSDFSVPTCTRIRIR